MCCSLGLGALPPAASITSVPLSMGTTAQYQGYSLVTPSSLAVGGLLSEAISVAPTIPSITHMMTAPLPLPQLQPGVPAFSFGQLPSVNSYTARPGMILSPASDPVPANLVNRIQSGQFIDMRDLLADNIALINQLSSLSGLVSLPLTTVHQTRMREIPSLASWLYCFNAYIAVRTTDPLTRQMLAYSRLIIREALRHGGSGWMEYDRVFRRQLAIDPSIPWNSLQPSLLAATVVSQPGVSQSGLFCSLCRESDHSSSACALSSMQQATYTTRPSQAMPVGVRPPRRPESALNICVNWNKGRCRRSRCTYRHICATCQHDHRAKDCAETPADSEYKVVALSSTASGAEKRT